ncbi:glycosyltransferase family 4 protein [Pedobacter sp. SD-b]|uniref:Glycosyltransferase family 4 protein n=1 Tax=Pedobacter segetis TaxID=2793069 RepID=A0ABS1BFK1_9SPHI|nr:glycosyltransferase family 4 protein [Pedobacter segetis]MBK0381649.1 glycosyltransferase family 4 protein [Pedobacter segetis]
MDSQKPKVLFITNMFPYPKSINFGVFVKEQIDCLVDNFGIIAKTYFINAQEEGNLVYLKSVFKIFRILKKDEEIDIIHIHYGLSALFLLFFRPKKKIFVTFHGSDILKKQGRYIQVIISKYIAKKVDKVFILNDEMEEIMKKLNVNYEVLPCGVNADFFDIDPGIQKKEENLRLVLFTGDPERSVKNYPLFKEVIQILKAKSQFNINFNCIHNMSRAEVRAVLNQSDCLLMTSISEGSPQVIKEALACNLPVVSVPVGDVGIVIQDIPNCFISDSYDANQLAALTIKALENRGAPIRETFLKKGRYENKAVCKRIFENYLTT